MKLDRNDFIMLQAIIDKELMPYVVNKVNKKYNVGHIVRELQKIIDVDVSAALLAQLLRQRGITEKKDEEGLSHFAISNKFFYRG